MPETKSGTLSAADITPKQVREMAKASVDLSHAADESAGPGLVEHGVGLARHRVEDGPVPAPGTVILVPPERGAE